MYNFLDRVGEVKKDLNTSAFARILGMGQKTVDLYLKGERKPSVEFVLNICSKFGVSADWLLGLPERETSITANGTGSIAAGNISHVTVNNSKEYEKKDCENCKYKRLADAFKAL